MTTRTPVADSLDQEVRSKLRDSWLGMFLTELFQGVSQLALFLLLLEAIWDGSAMFGKPDVYVLALMTIGQSTWLTHRQFNDLPNPWWTRLIGLLAYAVVESLIEGSGFFLKPKHVTFMVLTLVFVLGRSLEMRANKSQGVLWGTVLSRAAQGLGPLFFYIALDLRDQDWGEGFERFFGSSPHAFLLALAATQVGALIFLTLITRRQRTVIDTLLEQLKTLSRWGFGAHVVEEVLRDSTAVAPNRVERAIGFIDVRGFTGWSEANPPEAVIDLLNRFYAAVLAACDSTLIKSKMSGDEVLLVLPADEQAPLIMQNALRAALHATAPMQLTAGAGLWIGPVVEGFFGAQTSQIHDVIGDTVNTAKRLCDHASGGELLAGPITRLSQASTDSVLVQAKGKLLPIQAARYSVSINSPGKS